MAVDQIAALTVWAVCSVAGSMALIYLAVKLTGPRK